jgi:hypothetical protein
MKKTAQFYGGGCIIHCACVRSITGYDLEINHDPRLKTAPEKHMSCLVGCMEQRDAFFLQLVAHNQNRETKRQ